MVVTDPRCNVTTHRNTRCRRPVHIVCFRTAWHPGRSSKPPTEPVCKLYWEMYRASSQLPRWWR